MVVPNAVFGTVQFDRWAQAQAIRQQKDPRCRYLTNRPGKPKQAISFDHAGASARELLNDRAVGEARRRALMDHFEATFGNDDLTVVPN